MASCQDRIFKIACQDRGGLAQKGKLPGNLRGSCFNLCNSLLPNWEVGYRSSVRSFHAVRLGTDRDMLACYIFGTSEEIGSPTVKNYLIVQTGLRRARPEVCGT